MLRYAIIFLLFCVGLTACGGEGIVRQHAITDTGDAYELDAGDKLLITVFGQTDLSGQFSVDAGGYVTLPLLNPVMARGHTADELKAALTAELGRTLLRNPNVSIQITEFRPFFILGEVQSAGQYPYVSGMTIQKAVAISGGFSYRANTKIVRVTRKRDGVLIEVDLNINALVQPGDTILVKERFF